MKVSVRVRSEWLAVPCGHGEQTIGWLGNEALRRYMKLKGDLLNAKEETLFEVRRTRGGAIMDLDDSINTVLHDDDYISVVLESDRPSPRLVAEEMTYVAEQIPGKWRVPEEVLALDGNSLTPEDLLSIGRGMYRIKLTKESEEKVKDSRTLVEEILKENKVVYGITTGIGNFANTVIPKDKLSQLQVNIIRSHSAGVGRPLTVQTTRMLLALRINVLAKGYSGISLKTLQQIVDAFNANCLSWVPEQGTVGASGDLAPLAHLALGLMGEGKMWSPETGWGDAKYVLEAHNLKPISLGPKEGVALINGTQLITAIGAEALERAQIIARQGDVVAALSLEVLKGTSRAFDEGVHKIRPHVGQNLVAKRLRSLLHSSVHPSEVAESHRFCNRVQDAYTLRCCPQVHGIVHDTIRFVREIISTEMNSATDNPIVFSETGEIISAGNFHGEYPAKALDYLAIGIHELASMSERRIERLVNPATSGLPAFLINEGGLNSGFMMAHVTAAALVSENKVLCHPSSVDSLSTSAATEDHVSMGGMAARKALSIVENVEHVVAIELLAACQAIEFLRPLRTTTPLEEVYKLVRSVCEPLERDRFMAPDIEAVAQLLRDDSVWKAVKNHVEDYAISDDLGDVQPNSPTTSSLKRPLKTSQPSKRRRNSSGRPARTTYKNGTT